MTAKHFVISGMPNSDNIWFARPGDFVVVIVSKSVRDRNITKILQRLSKNDPSWKRLCRIAFLNTVPGWYCHFWIPNDVSRD